MGYDAYEGKYVDMFKQGVIDPTKVNLIKNNSKNSKNYKLNKKYKKYSKIYKNIQKYTKINKNIQK